MTEDFEKGSNNSHIEQNAEQKKCPNCGAEYKEGELVCSVCKFPLSNQQVINSGTNSTETSSLDENKATDNANNEEVDYKICPSCGNKCKSDALFCNKCGAKLIIEHKCPNCGTDYEQGDLFCTVCGTKLPVEQESEGENTKLYCPVCGTECHEGDMFCGVCGTNLPTVQATISSQPYANKNENINFDSSTTNNYDSHTVKCPYCGGHISRHTKKCPHCGEWLSGVSHFGCGSAMMIITTILAICIACGGESIGIPFVGEVGGIFLALLVFLYFMPSLIADWRGHDSKFAIFLVNLLFGWSVIGWFIALIFAFTGRSR